MGIVKFASQALTETELTSDVNKVISDLEASPYAAGATYTREGYDEAFKMLQENDRGGDYRKIVVFMTDGHTNTGLAPDA
jgi:uncharacterized protein YegL